MGSTFVDGAMVGDVEAESVLKVAGRLTPVPGGTGRVTTMVLIRNVIKAATLQFQHRGLTDVRAAVEAEQDDDDASRH